LNFSQKRSVYKVGAKEDVVAENIYSTKMKPCVLHQDNREDAFGASQDFSRSHSSHAQEFKGVNSFETLCLEKRSPGCPAHTETLREEFP
jgi:hypothetical protein